MSNSLRLRTLLRFTIALSCWLQLRHSAQARNITVPDTDSSIGYLPEGSWFSSTNLCATCINPGSSLSFHEGVHPPDGPDDDDDFKTSKISTRPKTSSGHLPSSSTPSSSSASAATTTEESHHEGKSKRSLSRVTPRLDADDGLVSEVTMSYNFTGSAVFLYASQPPSSNTMNMNETSSNMNISVFIDGVASPVLPMTNAPASTFVPGQLVFSRTGLEEAFHQLVVQVGENSTFIFQQLIYSTEAPATSPAPAQSTQSSPSLTTDSKSKGHNVATFAGAVGGSVGVLALFSLGLALSIIRRRHLAAKRERRDHESLHTNASDDSPIMVGPAPFVPRYFPDTVIPSDPPTYMAALATNHNNSTLLATLPPDAFGETQRSYADIPPTTPPPIEDLTVIIPPPPFLPPPPPFLPAVAEEVDEGALPPPPSIEGAQLPSHTPLPVGAEAPILAIAPETVPLLHQAVPPAPAPRPTSRVSSLSPLTESSESEPTEGTRLREDVA